MLGLRFESQEEKRQGMLAEGGSSGKGVRPLPRHASPVEVIPCGGNLFGKAYFVFVFPADDDNSPAAIFSAMSKIGPELEPADSSFKALELADEVNKDGVHKLGGDDILCNPFAAAVCMASCGDDAVAAFEHQLLAHDEELGKMMGHIRGCLPANCQRGAGSTTSTLNSMVLQASQQVSARIRLRVVRGDQDLRVQVLLGPCVMWELRMVEHQGSVLLTSPNLPGPGGADKTMAPAACRDATGADDGRANSGSGSNLTGGGSAPRPQPVGRVVLLRTGELWLCLEDAAHGGCGASLVTGTSAGRHRAASAPS